MSQQSGLAETRGHSLIWEQKWDEALKEFEVALKENPENPTIHDGIATAKRELGDIQGALIHFEKAAELTEQNTIYLRQVADLQQKMGETTEAAETFMRIGEKHLSQKRLTDAIDNWVLATRFNSDHLKAHERLAKVYENQDRPWLAVNEFLETARIYENQGQLNRALRACERALKIDPRNAEALTAAELLKTGERAFPNNSRGMADSNGSMRRNLHTGRLVNGTVEIPIATPIANKLQAAREKMAEEIFSTNADIVGSDDDINVMALISQGLTDQTQGNNEEAITSFTKVMDSGLRTSAILFTVAHLHQTLNQFAEAIPLFGEIEGDHDYEFVRLYCIGECFRGLGHIQQAVEHYINALKFIDLPTVPYSKRSRLETQYNELLDTLASETAVDQATSFALSFGRFLQTSNWDNAIQDARKRLDKLSTEPGSMILGDMLNAGSSRILESLQLAQEHSERGLYNSAIEEVYRAIEVSAGYLPAHIQMADLLIHKNKLPQAAQKLQVIGNTFLVRGDQAGAVGAFKKAVNITPLDIEMRQDLIDLIRDTGQDEALPEQYLGMGQACSHMAKTNEARQYFVEGLKLLQQSNVHNQPEIHKKLLRNLGDVEMKRLDWKRALPIWVELTKLDPDDTYASKNIIDILFNVEQPQKALKQLDQLLVQLIKAKKGREVVVLLEQLVASRPDEVGLADRLARLYLSQKQNAKAIKLLDGLGESLLEQGKNKQAAQVIKKILSLNPPNKSDYQQLLQQLNAL